MFINQNVIKRREGKRRLIAKGQWSEILGLKDFAIQFKIQPFDVDIYNHD